MVSQVRIVYGGELAKDVAEQVVAKKPDSSSLQISMHCASERPKALVDLGDDTIVCFILQTIENAAPTEEVSIVDCFVLPAWVSLFVFIVNTAQLILCIPFSTLRS